MAIVRKKLSTENYTKMDNQVARNKNISDYSYRLYGFMAGFKNGFQLNDAYIAKALGWNRSKVTRAKRDLTEQDLICVEKIDRSTYFLYIGTSTHPASRVKEQWKNDAKLDGQEVSESYEEKHPRKTEPSKQIEEIKITAENIFD